MRRLLSRRLRTLGATVVALVWAVAVAAPPALAHTGIDSASPGPGQRVAPGVEVLALTFSGLRADGDRQVTVTGPDEAPVPAGEPVLVDGATLCLAVTPLTEGVHDLSYRTTSQDGHPVEGSFLFEVAPDGEVLDRPEPCAGIELPPIPDGSGADGSGADGSGADGSGADGSGSEPAGAGSGQDGGSGTAIVAAVLAVAVAAAVTAGGVLAGRARRSRPPSGGGPAPSDQRSYL